MPTTRGQSQYFDLTFKGSPILLFLFFDVSPHVKIGASRQQHGHLLMAPSSKPSQNTSWFSLKQPAENSEVNTHFHRVLGPGSRLTVTSTPTSAPPALAHKLNHCLSHRCCKRTRLWYYLSENRQIDRINLFQILLCSSS